MASPIQASAMLNRDWEQVNSGDPQPVVAPDCIRSLFEIRTENRVQVPTLRRHVRISSKIRAVLYGKYRFQSVVIRNISRGGAGLDNCRHLIENDKVIISLMNGRRIEATVRWWLAGVCGVQFVELLEPTDILLTGRTGYTEMSKALSQALKTQLEKS